MPIYLRSAAPQCSPLITLAYILVLGCIESAAYRIQNHGFSSRSSRSLLQATKSFKEAHVARPQQEPLPAGVPTCYMPHGCRYGYFYTNSAGNWSTAEAICAKYGPGVQLPVADVYGCGMPRLGFRAAGRPGRAWIGAYHLDGVGWVWTSGTTKGLKQSDGGPNRPKRMPPDGVDAAGHDVKCLAVERRAGAKAMPCERSNPVSCQVLLSPCIRQNANSKKKSRKRNKKKQRKRRKKNRRNRRLAKQSRSMALTSTTSLPLASARAGMPLAKQPCLPVSGANASLTQHGYESVACTCCTPEMELFVRRVVQHEGFVVCHEGGLQGFLLFFDCVDKGRTYHELVQELRMADRGDCAYLGTSGHCPIMPPSCGNYPNVHRRRRCYSGQPESMVRLAGVTVDEPARLEGVALNHAREGSEFRSPYHKRHDSFRSHENSSIKIKKWLHSDNVHS